MGTLCSQSLCAGNALLQRRSEFTWIIAFALKAALLCWHPPPLFTDTRWQWLWCSPPRCLGKRGRLVRARAYVVCRGEPFSRREDEHKQKLSLEPKPPGGPNVLHFPGRPPMGASRFPPEKPQSPRRGEMHLGPFTAVNTWVLFLKISGTSCSFHCILLSFSFPALLIPLFPGFYPPSGASSVTSTLSASCPVCLLFTLIYSTHLDYSYIYVVRYVLSFHLSTLHFCLLSFPPSALCCLRP